MSVNYYVSGPGIEPAAPGDPGLHIGKHSGGLEYLFRGHPELNLQTVAQWREFVNQPGRQIIGEHHAPESAAEFFAMATRRPADPLAQDQIPIRSRGHRYRRDMDARGVPFLDTEFC